MSSKRSLLLLGALGAVVAAAAAAIPLSYDEGNWLAVVRRIAGGESLYIDLTDNKTPLLFALVRGLDWLPGPYTMSRAVWLGLLAVAIARGSRTLLLRSSWDERSATILGLVFGLAGAMQAVLTVNFELPAATLVVVSLAAIATGRPAAGGALAVVAGGFDIRALLLLPGVVMFAYARGGASAGRRAFVPAAGLAAAWIVTILAIPDLRYSLIELNRATRGGTAAWEPAEQLYALLRGTTLPLGAILALTSGSRAGRTRPAGVVLLAAGITAALASVQPFDKYWSLALPGLLVLAAAHLPSRRRESRGSALWLGASIAAVGLTVGASYATSSNVDQGRLVGRYERAAARVDATLGPGETLVRFDTQPFLGTFLPERDRLPAAVLDFLIANSSRRPENHRRVEEAIAQASVMADDGALSVGESAVLPRYRPLWRVFIRHVGEFPCRRTFGGVTFRYRVTACPTRE